MGIPIHLIIGEIFQFGPNLWTVKVIHRAVATKKITAKPKYARHKAQLKTQGIFIAS